MCVYNEAFIVNRPPPIPSPPSVSSNGSGSGCSNGSGSGGSSGSAPRAGTREVHNKLEKNRRAHLKECFELLKRQLPATPDDKKTSNLSILGSAIRYIQVSFCIIVCSYVFLVANAFETSVVGLSSRYLFYRQTFKVFSIFFFIIMVFFKYFQ